MLSLPVVIVTLPPLRKIGETRIGIVGFFHSVVVSPP